MHIYVKIWKINLIFKLVVLGNFEEQQKLFEVFILSDLLTDDVIRAKREVQYSVSYCAITMN